VGALVEGIQRIYGVVGVGVGGVQVEKVSSQNNMKQQVRASQEMYGSRTLSTHCLLAPTLEPFVHDS
jgi:hypothetical protein